MKSKLSVLILGLILLASPLSAQNSDKGNSINASAGVAVDLLPTVLSATSGEAGYSFQAWAGFENVKMRVVAAHLYQPDSMIDGSFENYEMNVAAFIIDYFFKENFRGFWIGTGAELWNCSIEHKASGEAAMWTDNILTLGAGYVWKITDSVYLDPFAAVHYRMNDSKVMAGGEEFTRQRVSASASVKIGYMFSI